MELRTLQLQVVTSNWFAINRACELGFTCSGSGSWVSDAEMPDHPDAKILWEDCRAESHDVVAEFPDAVVLLSRERRNISVSLYSKSQERNAELLDLIVKAMPRSERQSNVLDVTFWYHSQHGPRSYDRQLQAPSWSEIEQNYPTVTQEKLAALHKIEPKEEGSGKLVLWQGEPGTGKTFALRALAEEWANWCRIHYVLDPEKFFMEGDYLLSVILGQDAPPSAQVVAADSERPQWRLVVLEDAGEMLTKDAKMQVGQGLARLLNLCDGLLGQGLRVLVLITTNEQIGSLNAAVSRPGRCLAQINFEKFDAASAARWLESHGATAKVVKQASLADLYAMADGVEIPSKVTAGF
jgi:hypothetical protein